MNLSKTLLNAMLIAAAAGTIISCEKPKVSDAKKPGTTKHKTGIPDNCPACGMG